MEQSAFFVKLCELEEDYQAIRSGLQACQSLDCRALEDALEKVKYQYDHINLFLETCAKNGRSPAVAALSQAQEAYYQRAKQLLEQELPRCFDRTTHSAEEAQLETQMLYAEYAIDFARQSIYHALVSVLSALYAEKINAKEENKE